MSPRIMFTCELCEAFPGPFFIPIYIDHHVPSFWILVWFPWCKFIPILRDPVWRSEQRPELFEIGQDLTSEAVDGSAFEDVDIIASIV